MASPGCSSRYVGTRTKLMLMHVFDRFVNLNFITLHWINFRNIVLSPKKGSAEEISEYRPYPCYREDRRQDTRFLSWSRTTLFPMAKVRSLKSKASMTTSSTSRLKNLPCRPHKGKTCSLLFNLDTLKAFDSIGWDYILGLLQRHGFPSRFRK